MGWFGKKKEEKKKFDYSEDTKEMFAERDAFYANMRKQMGGGSENPELANQTKSDDTKQKQEDMKDLLGEAGDFNPYVAGEQSSSQETSISSPSSAPAPSSGFVCTSCGKDFQEKWGKCPSCGGSMKKVEAEAPTQSEAVPPASPSVKTTETASNVGDPLDDLLGDFDSSSNSSKSEAGIDKASNVKMVNDDDLSADFGGSASSPSNRRRVKKVRKVKRTRKSP